jgi:hypothetical protein
MGLPVQVAVPTMKTSTFWNRAFLAALHRLPAQAAREEADLAVKLALEHWLDEALELVPVRKNLWDMPLQRRARYATDESPPVPSSTDA